MEVVDNASDENNENIKKRNLREQTSNVKARVAV